MTKFKQNEIIYLKNSFIFLTIKVIQLIYVFSFFSPKLLLMFQRTYFNIPYTRNINNATFIPYQEHQKRDYFHQNFLIYH